MPGQLLPCWPSSANVELGEGERKAGGMEWAGRLGRLAQGGGGGCIQPYSCYATHFGSAGCIYIDLEMSSVQ